MEGKVEVNLIKGSTTGALKSVRSADYVTIHIYVLSIYPFVHKQLSERFSGNQLYEKENIYIKKMYAFMFHVVKPFK